MGLLNMAVKWNKAGKNDKSDSRILFIKLEDTSIIYTYLIDTTFI